MKTAEVCLTIDVFYKRHYIPPYPYHTLCSLL